jgi:hypothetical protein
MPSMTPRQRELHGRQAAYWSSNFEFGLLTWSEALDVIQEFGPSELIQRVRKAELDDPSGNARPRFKRHDDATVALCVLEETP